MNRFFGKVENIFSDHIIINGTDVNHIKNVLRLRIDDKISVTGADQYDYLCAIREFTEEEVILSILEQREADRELPARIHLFQGLPKGDKMELIIQKCVELGVYQIIPVAMKRCVVKLDDKKASSKISRWQAISESAAKQSGRSQIPSVHSVMSFKEALAYGKDMDVCMVPYELARGMEATKEVLEQIRPGSSVAVFIGPEGGFDPGEIELAMEQGFMPVSLGRRILRTETAGMAVMSIIMYHMEVQE